MDPIFARVTIDVADDALGRQIVQKVMSSVRTESMLETPELDMVDLTITRNDGRWSVLARVRLKVEADRRETITERLRRGGWTIEAAAAA